MRYVERWSGPAPAALHARRDRRVELVSAVDEYVFGFCLMERMNHARGDDGPGPELAEVRLYVDGLIATGGYPALRASSENPGLQHAWVQMQRQIDDPERFDRNLQRLLDGFEAGLRPPRAGRTGS